MTLTFHWLVMILAKAILELASGGLSAETRLSIENLVRAASEDAE